MKEETIEMRVHHLDMLKHHIVSGRKLEAIKDNLEIARYDKDVTEEEIESFATNIYNFYEKVLSGKYDIKLTSKPDGICDGGCTLRKAGNCNLEDVSQVDSEKAGIENYCAEIGRVYSLNEIIQIIEDEIDINW